ncbi:MAG: hypothetical protein V3U88_10715 [Methylococcales bacterium]
MNIPHKLIVLLALICSLTLAPINASQAMEASEIGYIAGSSIGSLIYTPIKFASALMLGIPGGLSLMGTAPVGAEKHSIDIVKLAMSGDWWISPDHFRGTKPFRFFAPLR